MSAKNFMWPVLFLFSAVILSCDGSALLDDPPADGDGSAQLLYRDCLRNGDCESRMCVEARNQAIGFCSMPCSRDAECEDVLAFTCCEVKGGYCKPPSRCVGDEPPDGDEPVDGDATDGDLDEETDGDGNSDGDSDDYWDVCCATSLECCLEHGDICGERCDWAQGRCTRHEHCPEDYVCAADGWCVRKPPRPDGDEPDGDTDGDEPDGDTDGDETDGDADGDEETPNNPVCDPRCDYGYGCTEPGICKPYCWYDRHLRCDYEGCLCSASDECIGGRCVYVTSARASGCQFPCKITGQVCMRFPCERWISNQENYECVYPDPRDPGTGWWIPKDRSRCDGPQDETTEFCEPGTACIPYDSGDYGCQAVPCWVSCEPDERCAFDECYQANPIRCPNEWF